MDTKIYVGCGNLASWTSGCGLQLSTREQLAFCLKTLGKDSIAWQLTLLIVISTSQGHSNLTNLSNGWVINYRTH